MLNLPANFKNDIAGRDTNLIPVIYIGNYVGSHSEYIVISTNQNPVADKTLPILLNVPSLKESIDIEKRNYKISSVNLDISNFTYEGKRFSEIIAEHNMISSSLINVEVRIFWTSPSARGIRFIPEVNDDAFLVYFGTIRRYDHDDEKVRLVVEDRSQATLHKDLPLEKNYLTENNGYIDVPDKYKNKPIPMVYGFVNNSPCVIDRSPSVTTEYSYGNVNLLVDVSSLPWANQLRIFSNDTYLSVPDTLENVGDKFKDSTSTDENSSYYAEDLIQWVRSGLGTYGNTVTLISSGNHEDNSINPIADNRLVVMQYIDDMVLSELKLKSHYWEISDHVGTGHYTSIIAQTIEENDSIAGTFVEDSGSDEAFSWDGSSELWTIENTSADVPDNWTAHTGSQWGMPAGTCITNALSEGGNFEDRIGRLIYEVGIYAGNMDTDTVNPTSSVGIVLRIGGDSLGDAHEPSSSININENAGAYWHLVSNEAIPFIGRVFITNVDKLLIYIRPKKVSADTAKGALKLHFKTLRMENYLLAKDVIAQDYYATVIGRESDTEYPYTSPEAPVIIKDILVSELDQLETDIDTLPTDYDWKYAFTVDKKINSKKLIEGIASASPYIPRFDNMGNFKFDVIPMDGGSITSDDHHIKEADVIDFSFSRTKIEDVYTKIEFKYNWDYARGEFNDSVESDTDLLLGGESSYDPTYYGFKVDGEYDHAESTLVIADDRGKYIRDHGTAEKFANWFLLWSCNQHLKIKIKLPLKYMNLEIGDLVDFDAILGGVKPYGINYKARIYYTETLNNQYIFKNFLITSTNKTLEWVEVECIQMHYLSFEELPDISYQFIADTEYNVIASSELNGVSLTDIHENFPVLGNLLVIIDELGNEMVYYGTLGWMVIEPGTSFDIVAGSQYDIVFSVDTTTSLFLLNENSTTSNSGIDVYEHNIEGNTGTSEEIFNKDMVNGNFDISNLSIRSQSVENTITSATFTANQIMYDAEITTNGNKQLLTFLSNTPVTIFNTNEMEDLDVRNHIYTFTITTSDLKTYNIHRNIAYTFNKYNNIGDINGDGKYNVLDVVALSNGVISGNCKDIEDGVACDLTGDGGYNILDITTLANSVLSGSLS